MAEQPQTSLIEKDLRPAYYDDFHCIMGACKYNCCDDYWKIEFSKKDYLTLKHAPKSPEMEELTRKCVRRLREREHDGMYAELHGTETARCAFHTPEGLCRLQLECGEKAVPLVCQVFPRHEAYLTSGYLERSLSPGCEAVLSLLWDLPEGIQFRSGSLPKDRQKRMLIPESDSPRLWFPTVRMWCIDLLQDRRFSLPQRIWLMGLGLKELAEDTVSLHRWTERAAILPDSVDISDLLPTGNQELAMYLGNCVSILSKIKASAPSLRSVKAELLESMELEPDMDTGNITVPVEPYLNALARYEENFSGRDYFMENLMVSIFFHLNMPHMASREALWKGYVNFCNLYAFYRFLAVMSCRKGAPGDRDELFRLMVFASRSLIHDNGQQTALRDELFKNDSATLAHMAILLR